NRTGLKTPPIAVLACFLLSYAGCATGYAQSATPCPSASEDPAAALTSELKSSSKEVRESSAKALQAMGKKAAKALEYGITCSNSLDAVTKAITVLGKIGKDIADDTAVQDALIARAKANPDRNNWDNVQLQIAAIDALGEINKYRSAIFGKETPWQSPTPI